MALSTRYGFVWGLLGMGALAKAEPPMHTLNNQCPVCGTMAPDYRRSEWVQYNAAAVCWEGRANSMEGLNRPCSIHDAPTSRTVRCKRCNVRFDQDATD